MPCHEAGRRSRTTSASSASTTSPEAAYLIPPLTTIRQDFPAVGRRAIEVLQNAIAGEPARTTRDWSCPEFVVRASSAPPGETCMSEQYVVGVDFGTLSGRAVVVAGHRRRELG